MTKFKFILILLLFFSCSFDNLSFNKDEDENEGVEIRMEYDSSSDTLSYYEDDSLIWKELYDFDTNGNPVFVKRLTSNDTILESRLYSWSGGNIELEAYYGVDNTLSYFTVYSYSGDKISSVSEYNSSSNLNSYETFTYSLDSIDTNMSYSSDLTFNWGKTYTYNSDEDITRSEKYGADSSIEKYIEYSYDGDYYTYMATGYGSGSIGEYISSFVKPPCFDSKVVYGGVNTEDRNSEALVLPVKPEEPLVAPPTLIHATLDYNWMEVRVSDDYGETRTLLNSSYKPVLLKRSAPEYFDGYIKTALTYDLDKIKSKSTTYNGDELLSLGFTYDSSSRPINLSITGEVMLLPMDYGFTYHSDYNLPTGISASSGDQLLIRLEYIYKTDMDLAGANILNIGEYLDKINQYNGDNELQATYTFSYEDSTLTISVTDSTDTFTGTIKVSYNLDGLATALTSFSPDGDMVWDYSYGYDDLGNRVSEVATEMVDGVEVPVEPDMISEIDIKNIIGDLGTFLPLD